tara:strand:+ start:1095 stop:1868 length:774 start_codon:yes stop_codon:yes gene_type:complete
MTEVLLNQLSIGDFKGILFDKDGTICNSELHLLKVAKERVKEVIKEVRNQILESEKRELKKLLDSLYGITPNGLNPNCCTAIASRNENITSTASIISIFLNNWPASNYLAREVFSNADIKVSETNNYPDKRPLMPGVRKFLDELKSSQLKCGIISNDTNEGIEEFLRINNLENNFCGYWSCEDSPSKPNPKAIKKFCKAINLSPSECLLIGDSDSDLRMAREAGIGMAMGFTSGWQIKPSLKFHQKSISNWDEISCP